MPTPSSNARATFKVLVAIDADVLDLKGDYSIGSSAVLRLALSECSREKGAELHLVTVTSPGDAKLDKDGGLPHASLDLAKLASDEISAFAKKNPPLELGQVVTHVLSGPPADDIVWLAARVSADLLVIGSHGHKGPEHSLLGAVAEKVVKKAGCTVLVARVKQHDAAWTTPAIDPPCKECLAARAKSGGQQMWCDRHLEHHARAHTYSDNADSALTGVGPWGFDG